MPHILIAGKIHEAGVALVKAAPGVTYDLIDEVTTEAYAPFLPKADGIVIRTQPMTAAEIAAAPRLKIVSRHGVGYDAVDVQALSARGIPLAIVGDVNSRAVAEHAMMLMLAAARRLMAHDKAARSGQWNVRNRFETAELDGKCLLVAGFGRIGRRVAALAQAFGMQVLAHDPLVLDESIRAARAEPVPVLADALNRADVVSLHMPMAPKGVLIGAAELALMKPTAIIVNTARGGLVDEQALDAALRQGRLGAAAFDVMVEEPPQPDHPLLGNPCFLITPHSAGLTQECTERMAIAAVQNVLDCFNGKLDPKLVVNAAEVLGR